MWSALALSTTITASGGVRLGGQPVEHPAEQVGPVVGHDDDRDGLGAARLILQVPPVAGEVARSPAYIAPGAERSRAGPGLVNM